MKITLIEPRGFCFGACRALQMLDDVVADKPYVLHEIVHNKQIIREYETNGVRFVDSLTEVPNTATLVLSAHGVGSDTEQTARQRFSKVIDTTCPFVKKVHDWVVKLEEEGYTVVLIGKKGHAEINGTLGRLKKEAFVVSSVADVDALPNLKRIGIATQTTLSIDETADIIAALQHRFSDVRLQNGICRATTERQHAVQLAAKTNDIILVVGDKKSSNANRLVEVAKTSGAKAFLIETVSDLTELPLSGKVAITAAASAPEEIVQAVYKHLKTNQPLS